MDYHDAHLKDHTFNLNDTVWMYRQSEVEKGITSKLFLYSWNCPYVIAEKIGEVNLYRLIDMKGKYLLPYLVKTYQCKHKETIIFGKARQHSRHPPPRPKSWQRT